MNFKRPEWYPEGQHPWQHFSIPAMGVVGVIPAIVGIAVGLGTLAWLMFFASLSFFVMFWIGHYEARKEIKNMKPKKKRG